MKVSNCCGVPVYLNLDTIMENEGTCPKCKSDCKYIDEEYYEAIVIQELQKETEVLKQAIILYEDVIKIMNVPPNLSQDKFNTLFNLYSERNGKLQKFLKENITFIKH